MFARVAGAFRSTLPQVRVLNAFRKVRNVYVLVNGEWRPAWSFRWDAGGWSGCSQTCGGGTQTRTVRCLRSDGTAMDDAFCSQLGSKPAASQSCNTQPCYTYGWDWGAWGSCSASCGYGTHSRSVWCRRSDGATVSNSYCSSQTKPSTSESCWAGTCITHSWSTGTFGSCSASCGAGTQTRTVVCKGSDGSSAADSKCSGTKPSTSQSCTVCNGCTNDFSNYGAYLQNKLKHVKATGNTGSKVCPELGLPTNPKNWVVNDVYAQITWCEKMSVSGHFVNWGKSEGVCPFSNATCCQRAGYRYY